MTAEWFDLGQRLAADHSRTPQRRLWGSTIYAPALRNVIAVRAVRDGSGLVATMARRGTAPVTVTNGAVFDTLIMWNATIDAATAPTLLTDTADTLPALLAAAATATGTHETAAAMIGYWADRTDFPGTTAVINIIDRCRTQWVLGVTPRHDTNPAVWRTWLGITDDTVTGLFTMLDLATRRTPLPLLAELAEDDDFMWTRAKQSHADGWNWRRKDSKGQAAVGLQARSDAVAVYDAALLSDPLNRRRAHETGHVATGTVTTATAREVHVTVARLDTRLRVGNQIVGWVGAPDLVTLTRNRFTGEVTDTAVTSDSQLVVTLRVGTIANPTVGDTVTLMPSPPNRNSIRNNRSQYRRLYGTRRSFLTTGQTPTVVRRDVPLEVMVAAADDH